MNGIITFSRKGSNKEFISSFSFATANTPYEVYQTMHRHDIREQIGQYIKDNLTPNMDNRSIGYVIESMPNFQSRLYNLEIRSGEQWERKLYSSIK